MDRLNESINKLTEAISNLHGITQAVGELNASLAQANELFSQLSQKFDDLIESGVPPLEGEHVTHPPEPEKRKTSREEPRTDFHARGKELHDKYKHLRNDEVLAAFVKYFKPVTQWDKDFYFAMREKEIPGLDVRLTDGQLRTMLFKIEQCGSLERLRYDDEEEVHF